MNKLLHHLHSSIQLIQSQNILLSKEPQTRALPKILSEKERLSEDGETCLQRTSKLGFQKKSSQNTTKFTLYCCHGLSPAGNSEPRQLCWQLQEHCVTPCWRSVLPANNSVLTNPPVSPIPTLKQKGMLWNKALPTLTFLSYTALYTFILKCIFLLFCIFAYITHNSRFFWNATQTYSTSVFHVLSIRDFEKMFLTCNQ